MQVVSNVLRAARWKCRTEKIAKNCHLGTIAQLCWAIFATKAHIDNRKILLDTNASPTRPHDMVNIGPLPAEICWRVFGHACKFRQVSRLGRVIARHSSSGRQPNFAALNRQRHLYSAARPSRWAMAHS